MEVQQLAEGLWRWTAPHPEWNPGDDWGRDVGCVYAECRGAIVLVDPLAPPADDAERFWRALDRDRARLADRDVAVLLTVSWHDRSANEIVARYGASLWQPGDAQPPPAGVEAHVVEGDGWCEALLYLADHRALVVGDLLSGDGAGGVRFGLGGLPEASSEEATARIREQLLPALEWPAELVLVSHGEPVVRDGAAALRRALTP